MLKYSRLPSIVDAIRAASDRTQVSLSEFPEPTQLVLKLISAFAINIKDKLKGNPTDGRDGFVQRFNVLCEGFVRALRMNAPRFRPFPKEKVRQAEDDAEEGEEGEGTAELLDQANAEPEFLVDKTDFDGDVS